MKDSKRGSRIRKYKYLPLPFRNKGLIMKTSLIKRRKKCTDIWHFNIIINLWKQKINLINHWGGWVPDFLNKLLKSCWAGSAGGTTLSDLGVARRPPTGRTICGIAPVVNLLVMSFLGSPSAASPSVPSSFLRLWMKIRIWMLKKGSR